MLELVLVLSAGLGSPALACSETPSSSGYHISDVCSASLEGAPAYSATFGASLSPEPASQQVMIYRRGDAWFMRIAGYRWERGSTVVTRRRDDIAVSDVDAQALVSRLTRRALKQLSELPYYGSEDVICTDGASLELAMASGGRKFRAAQHSCAGKTRMNEIATIFRQIALKYDPEFADLLSGLKN